MENPHWKLGNWHLLAKHFPVERLESSVRSMLNEKPSEPLFIACSGGSDSLCLLLLVRIYWPERKCILLHFDHAVRPTSTLESQYIDWLGRQLELETWIGKRNTSNEVPSEALLRNERYAFFKKILNFYSGKFLLLGHQQDDLTENLFMRLGRGSNLEGLVAPKPVQIFADGHVRLRPLLTLSNGEIKTVLQTLGIRYTDDESNQQLTFLRNRVRNRLFPVLDAVFTERDWRQGIARSRQLLQESQEALTYYSEQLLNRLSFHSNALEVAPLKQYPRAVVRYALMRWFASKNLLESVDAAKIETILNGLEEELTLKCSVGNQRVLSLTREHLKLVCKESLMPVWPTHPLFERKWGELIFPEKKSLTMFCLAAKNTLRERILKGCYSDGKMVFLDAERLQAPLRVRQWQSGDRYQPLGFKGDKKLKNLFVERKINASIKPTLPVICTHENEIIWVPGLPPAAKFCVSPKTNFCVLLTYKLLKNTLKRTTK